MTTLIVLGAVAGAIVWLVTRDQPQQNAAAAQRWGQFDQYATANQLQLLYIDSDYQHARQGSKAVVYEYGNPAVKRDARGSGGSKSIEDRLLRFAIRRDGGHTPTATTSSTSVTSPPGTAASMVPWMPRRWRVHGDTSQPHKV
ncbi:hypothetical protein [Mycobacteroides abscessus]|uniref:hypothetical protein n=1 Tax=Mycobacteroides abscessus TaxID=36809 RepID=UPI000C262135|nr:hypothetical protein [Mycobacteroides abscessus]